MERSAFLAFFHKSEPDFSTFRNSFHSVDEKLLLFSVKINGSFLRLLCYNITNNKSVLMY